VTTRIVEQPTPSDFDLALDAVREHLRPTPLIPTEGGFLKLECLQPGGSFKIRGAVAALSALRGAAVVTASAGNHALGVLHAAALLGIDATVVVPTTASPAKVAKLQRLGVKLIQYGDDYDAAERYALQLADEGATYVSPYNDPHVIAGQATIGPELRSAVDGPFTVVAGVGGGGLVAGLALWAATEPEVIVVGVECAASQAVSTAVRAGELVPVEVGPTLADGLAGNLEPGSITPAILAQQETTLAAVSEEEIREAIRYLAVEHGLIVEGSGAVGVAAQLAGKLPSAAPLVHVLTGRNIALPILRDVLA
jgi:threonine dehydratase